MKNQQLAMEKTTALVHSLTFCRSRYPTLSCDERCTKNALFDLRLVSHLNLQLLQQNAM